MAQKLTPDQHEAVLHKVSFSFCVHVMGRGRRLSAVWLDSRLAATSIVCCAPVGGYSPAHTHPSLPGDNWR